MTKFVVHSKNNQMKEMFCFTNFWCVFHRNNFLHGLFSQRFWLSLWLCMPQDVRIPMYAHKTLSHNLQWVIIRLNENYYRFRFKMGYGLFILTGDEKRVNFLLTIVMICGDRQLLKPMNAYIYHIAPKHSNRIRKSPSIWCVQWPIYWKFHQ